MASSSNRLLRAPWHDYTGRCIYMVTINKHPATPAFGVLAGDYRLPLGQPGCSFISTSATGTAIKTALRRLSTIGPGIRLLQYAIMPDHLHLLLFVEEATDEILGRVIARLKVEVNHAAGMESVFEKGFHELILTPARSLDAFYHYLRDNPRRLAVRHAHPEYFRRINTLEIAGHKFKAYGNFQLLANPYKLPVIVHHSDSLNLFHRRRAEWLYTAANGGVLVSPFISKPEKALRAEAEGYDGKIILITNAPMPERWKPAAHDFELCTRGRLLILSPLPELSSALNRSTCLAMNGMAEAIACG